MKVFIGKISSTKMTLTATVVCERSFRHKMYGKIIRRSKKIHAHNGIGAKEGDLVEIMEIKPIAKTVNFKIIKIIGKNIEKPLLEKEVEKIEKTEKKVIVKKVKSKVKK